MSHPSHPIKSIPPTITDYRLSTTLGIHRQLFCRKAGPQSTHPSHLDMAATTDMEMDMETDDETLVKLAAGGSMD